MQSRGSFQFSVHEREAGTTCVKVLLRLDSWIFRIHIVQTLNSVLGSLLFIELRRILVGLKCRKEIYNSR